MSQRIYLSPPHLSGNEQEYVQEAFSSNWVSPFGHNIEGFESELENYLDIPYASLTSSATAAIHLALVILGIKRGDHVLCPSMTFAGSVNPILYEGGIPVFVDSEPETWNINPTLLRQAIEDLTKKNKKPRALILVHIYGVPCKVTEILSICKEFEIPVIEDAADALGSSYTNQMLGVFGDIGVISFNGNKIITTSGGGVLVSRNKAYVEKAKYLSNQAKENTPYYQHNEVGYNYRMSNILAGIGRGQLTVIEDRIRERRRNFDYYVKHLANIEGFSFQKELLNGFSNRWLSAFVFNEGEAALMRVKLEAANIESRPLWKPMHLQPVFEMHPKYIDGTSENLFETGICLPSGSNLKITDLERICEILVESKSFV